MTFLKDDLKFFNHRRRLQKTLDDELLFGDEVSPERLKAGSASEPVPTTLEFPGNDFARESRAVGKSKPGNILGFNTFSYWWSFFKGVMMLILCVQMLMLRKKILQGYLFSIVNSIFLILNNRSFAKCKFDTSLWKVDQFMVTTLS